MVNQLAVVGSVGATTLSVLPGINQAAGILGSAVQKADRLKNISSAAYSRGVQAYSRGMGTAMAEGISEAGAGAGLLGLGSTLGNIDRMSKVPNQAQGATGGNARMQCGYEGFYIAQKYLRPEQAIIADDFFEMYGYQVDRVAIPDINSRPYWNYVKMQNSCHRGNVPSDDMALINSIFDNGITFWHTSDIGNYSLDNHR